MKTTDRTNGKQAIVKHERSKVGTPLNASQVSSLAQAMSMQPDGTLSYRLEENFERAFQLLITYERKLKLEQEDV